MTKPKYEIGYGKPPKEHQFQKGRSGNPKGRPKRSESFRTIVDKVMGAPISSTDAKGRKRTMTVAEALFKTLVGTGLKGDTRCLKLALDYYLRTTEEQQQSPEEFALEFHQTLRAMEASVCGGPPIEIAADNDNDPESVLRRHQRS